MAGIGHPRGTFPTFTLVPNGHQFVPPNGWRPSLPFAVPRGSENWQPGGSCGAYYGTANPARKTSCDRPIDWAALAQPWHKILGLLRLDSRCSGAVGARQALRGVPRQVGAAGRGGGAGGRLGESTWNGCGTGLERVWNGGGGTGTETGMGTYPFPFNEEAMPSHLCPKPVPGPQVLLLS